MMDETFCRAALLLGEEAMKHLQTMHVAVFGIGGVGSYVVEGLARCGIGALSLYDADTVCKSNLNRQIIATLNTIGQRKVEVAKARLLEINPHIQVDANDVFIDAETVKSIDFPHFDYMIDAIDTVTSKLLLIEQAKRHHVPIISCMGTGNKLDPTKFEITDIKKTSMCPLAKVMRRELKARGISSLKVLYSKEPPIKPSASQLTKSGSDLQPKRQTPGSVSFVPSVAGLIIAGEVIKDLIKTKE